MSRHPLPMPLRLALPNALPNALPYALPSDLYDFGNNERMLGKALEGKTDVFITTKWGPQIVPGKGIVADFSR